MFLINVCVCKKETADPETRKPTYASVSPSAIFHMHIPSALLLSVPVFVLPSSIA